MMTIELSVDADPVVGLRADTAHGVLTVLGPIAERHGVGEGLKALMIALVLAEQEADLTPREVGRCLAAYRKRLEVAASRLEGEVSVQDIVTEMHLK